MAICRFYGRVQVSCLWPQNIGQIQQALKKESTEQYTRILSMRRPGRAVMTAHGALLRVMSIVIFTFTPDGIQHALMTVKFLLLY